MMKSTTNWKGVSTKGKAILDKGKGKIVSDKGKGVMSETFLYV
jgi:hypothetical protein